MAALADGGVTMKRHGRARRRQPDGRRRRHRPGAPEADRPDRHPRLQRRPTRARPAPPRCAPRSWRSRPARPTTGLAVGVEKLAGAGLLGAAARARATTTTWTPQGRYGAVAPVDGRIGTETMPGVFAQIGMEYGHKYGGTSFELFARITREEPRALDAEPARGLPEADDARGDHERRHDRLPEHAADVLGELRRRRGRGRRQRREAEDALARAAAAAR